MAFLLEKNKRIRFLSKIKYKSLAAVMQNLKKKSFQNSYLLRILGSIYEFTRDHEMSIKLYVIFFKINEEDKGMLGRINLIGFWNYLFHGQQRDFSGILRKNYFFHLEFIIFSAKSEEKKGDLIQAMHFWRKAGRLFFMKIKKVKLCKNYDAIVINWFNFCSRTNKKKLGLTKKKYLDNCLFIQKKKSNVSLKFFFFTLQNYMQVNKMYNFFKEKEIYYFYKNLNFSKKTKNPIILEIWKKSQVNKKKSYFEKYNKIFLRILTFHFKWFVCFSAQLLKKKNSFSFCLAKIFSSKRVLGLKESYSRFSRNYRLKNNFVTKVAKFQMLSGSIIRALKIFKFMAKTNYNNIEGLNIVTRIKEKIATKFDAFESFRKGIKFIIRKNFKLQNNYFTENSSIFKLLTNAENFFEKKRIVALSHLIISLFFFESERILNIVKLKENSEKKTQKKKHLNSTFRDYLIKLDYSGRATRFAEKETHQKVFFLFFETLINKVFFYLYKNYVFSLEKSFDFIISNSSFFRENSCFFRHFCILMVLKKKKFQKAYTLLRIQCIERPYSFGKWCLLGKVENHIGALTSKTLRFSLRLLMRYPTSIPGIIFAGNHCSIFGSFGYSLAEYFQAYRWKKDSPFLNFLIFIQYLNGSLNRRNINHKFSIFLSLCFFSEYKRLRHFTGQVNLERNKWSILLEIEIIYNTARLYLFLGLEYLALKTFQKGLNMIHVPLTLGKNRRLSTFFLRNGVGLEILFNTSILFCSFGNKLLSRDYGL